ncbi:hypothetical protein [Chitinophaga sp.]|uniref:hypothetical protein n=1 Tax=Chitinophaga sp. TaxID=1869181 RepID=UPI002F92C6D8
MGIATTQAQSILDQAKKTAGGVQGSSFDAGGIANSILGKLTPALSLTDAQQPKVQSVLTDFMKKKSTIMPLQQTNPTDYTSKFGALQKGGFSKLKTLMTLSQYTKFLGLKPKTNDATNVLSQLFY